MPNLTPNSIYEAILAGEDVAPSSREQAFLENAVQSGGGSDLPEVTSADNGDVLTVVEGVWSKAAPSGGKFVVTLTKDTTDPEHPVWSASHDGDPISIAEIVAANNAGQICVATDGTGDVPVQMQLVSGLSAGDMAMVVFSSADSVDEISFHCFIGVNEGSGDHWDDLSRVIREIPNYDTLTDAGKALFVGQYNLEWTKPIDHYSFAFTVTVDQSDPTQYVCTPASGVTYAAIQAALSETDNVYAVATLPNGGVLKALFNNIDSTGVAATNVFYTGSSFSAYRVLVHSDDSCSLAIKALANA